ncbi:MAG TPA: tryptophan synthase subunit alpha [Dehalococcoidia bacterium]|nr:tryptophan synthase subunit alpha [Dehalococcoidia bacterium]
MGRIATCFEALRRRGEMGLIAYLPVGYPDVEATLQLVPALLAGGAHMVELGVPFSDPLADGATIQRATQVALERGVTPRSCLETVAALRRRGVAAPLVLMTYCNPVLAYGLDRFAADAAAAGVDGLIVVDLPWEEAGQLLAACRRVGLDLVPLVAPTTSDARLERIGREASGFIYCVSVTGVTGAREELPADLPGLLQRVRARSRLPLAVGFGISKRKHVESLRPWAEAVVVGSAIVQCLDGAPPHEREERVKEYVEVLAGRRGQDEA